MTEQGAGRMDSTVRCLVPGCDRASSGKPGLCTTHYIAAHASAMAGSDPATRTPWENYTRRDQYVHHIPEVARRAALDVPDASGGACIVPGCDEPVRARGLCSWHRWDELHAEEVSRLKAVKVCVSPGCDEPPTQDAFGLCSWHRFKQLDNEYVASRAAEDAAAREEEPPAPPETCRVSGCSEPPLDGRHICAKHSKTHYQTGTEIPWSYRHDWVVTALVVIAVIVVLYLVDPSLLAEPWRLFRWFGGGSNGN